MHYRRANLVGTGSIRQSRASGCRVAEGIVTLMAILGLVLAVKVVLAAGPGDPANGQTSGEPPQGQNEQQPQTVIRTTTAVVDVYAVVEDKHHRLIPDLTKDSFSLAEDGSPQEIRYFSKATDTPLTIGILVDTSPSQQRVLSIEQQQAKAFVAQVVRPKDLVFVMHFDVECELLQDLTGERARLDKAIDETVINGGGGGPIPSTFPTGSNAGATHLYDAVYLASGDVLKNEVGRKVIIMLTDGEDQGSKLRVEQALEAAQKANVMIYSIDISDRMFYGNLGYGGEDVLKKLSESTGGRVIKVNRPKDAEEAFNQIAAELRTQYLLGYAPTNTRHDGGYRKIQVKANKGEYKVQARRGYYAPAE